MRCSIFLRKSEHVRWVIFLVLGLGGVAALSVTPAWSVTIDMVTVGDPGNANDVRGTYQGAVPYSYQIGKYDVTIGQYAEFLNAVAATDPYSVYNESMGTDGNTKGIQRNGSAGAYTYTVLGSPNRPITASWFNAVRFANWMTNGQGLGSTETGAYTLNGATSGNAVAANPGAAFRIPTENEWYKAAYYSPNYCGPGRWGYYVYATQSEVPPGNMIGDQLNQANYYIWGGSGFSVTQDTSYDPTQNYLTDVGAFTNSSSFYGTFDQSGNNWQWNDLDGTPGPARGIRGGTWSAYDTYDLFRIQSSYNSWRDPTAEFPSFRLASPAASSVPEIDPNSLGSILALVLGSLGLLERRRLGHSAVN